MKLCFWKKEPVVKEEDKIPSYLWRVEEIEELKYSGHKLHSYRVFNPDKEEADNLAMRSWLYYPSCRSKYDVAPVPPFRLLTPIRDEAIAKCDELNTDLTIKTTKRIIHP